MKITTSRIAEMAGVSRTTVDKVIHNRPGVGEETREKVLRIMRENSYRKETLRIYEEPALSSALQATEEGKDVKRIAIVMPGSADYFMTQLKDGMEAYAAGIAADFQIDFYDSGYYDSDALLSVLEYLKTAGPDGIAVRCTQDSRLIELVNGFEEEGIPVFTFDADLPASNRTCFIGEDFYTTGRIAASMLCRSIGGQGEVALLTGKMNTDSSVLRVDGFRSYIEENAPGVTVVSVEETLSQPVITYRKTVQLLENYPDLKGIWNAVSYSTEMARAVTDRGAGGKIKLGAMTFAPGIVKLVKDHIIDFTIGLAPRSMGKLVVRSLTEYIDEKILPGEDVLKTPVYVGIDETLRFYTGELAEGEG